MSLSRHAERALRAFLAWRGDARAKARRAVEAAPDSVMAHVLEAQMHLCGRDPSGAATARAALVRARALPQDARSRMHVAALGKKKWGQSKISYLRSTGRDLNGNLTLTPFFPLPAARAT